MRATGGSRENGWSKGHDKTVEMCPTPGDLWRDCGSDRRWHSAVEENAGSPRVPQTVDGDLEWAGISRKRYAELMQPADEGID